MSMIITSIIAAILGLFLLTIRLYRLGDKALRQMAKTTLGED